MTTEARLLKMERKLRAITIVWLISLVAFLVLTGMAQRAASQEERMRVRGLAVVDAAGRPRILLSVLADGQSGVTFWDTSGRMRLGLNMLVDGTVGVGLFDSAERIRGSLSARQDGASSLILWDSAGRVLFQAP